MSRINIILKCQFHCGKAQSRTNYHTCNVNAIVTIRTGACKCIQSTNSPHLAVVVLKAALRPHNTTLIFRLSMTIHCMVINNSTMVQESTETKCI